MQVIQRENEVENYFIRILLDSLLAIFFMLVSYIIYSSTLKMEAICTSGTAVEFYRTTRRYGAPFIAYVTVTW
jgi:hypothetical protein